MALDQVKEVIVKYLFNSSCPLCVFVSFSINPWKTKYMRAFVPVQHIVDQIQDMMYFVAVEAFSFDI